LAFCDLGAVSDFAFCPHILAVSALLEPAQML